MGRESTKEGPEASGLQTPFHPDSGKSMAGATGLEPATSGSTVRSSNQLSYAPTDRKIPAKGPGILAIVSCFLKQKL